MIKQLLLFTRLSLELDVRTFHFKPLNLFQQLEFIIKKYYIIFKHGLLKKFELGDKVTLAGRSVYYDSSLGLAGYQSMITRHNRLLDSGHVSNIHTIIDCGANVGFYSLFIKQKYPKARLFSIEPIPKVFELLTQNLKFITNTSVFNVAISDKPGNVSMDFDDNNSVVSKISDSGTVDVAASTLDEFCKSNNITDVDLLKVDTEGHEVSVLQGAQFILRRTRYLVIELNLLDEDYTISKLLSLLSTDNFDFQLVSYRNYSGKAEGRVNLMDLLLVNRKLVKKSHGK